MKLLVYSNQYLQYHHKKQFKYTKLSISCFNEWDNLLIYCDTSPDICLQSISKLNILFMILWNNQMSTCITGCALTSNGCSSFVHVTTVTGYGVPITLQSKFTDSPSVLRLLNGGLFNLGGTKSKWIITPFMKLINIKKIIVQLIKWFHFT